MDDAETERIAKRVAALMPPQQRRSGWTTPAVILAILSGLVGQVFVYGKLTDHVDSLDSRVKGVEDATFSQKDAGVALGDLKDKIDDIRKRDDSLEADVKQLLIEVAQDHRQR